MTSSHCRNNTTSRWRGCWRRSISTISATLPTTADSLACSPACPSWTETWSALYWVTGRAWFVPWCVSKENCNSWHRWCFKKTNSRLHYGDILSFEKCWKLLILVDIPFYYSDMYSISMSNTLCRNFEMHIKVESVISRSSHKCNIEIRIQEQNHFTVFWSPDPSRAVFCQSRFLLDRGRGYAGVQSLLAGATHRAPAHRLCFPILWYYQRYWPYPGSCVFLLLQLIGRY